MQVRRQHFRTEVRRGEIEAIMRKTRLKLQYSSNQIQPTDQDLTPQQLNNLSDKMENQHYSTDSLLRFIKTILTRRTASLNQPLLFSRIRHILDYIEEREEFKIAKQMVKQLCSRVVVMAVDRPFFLQKCFRQFFQLISVHSNELHQIWIQVALIRNEIFFRASMQWYFEFIRSYPHEIDDILNSLIKTFFNFTYQDNKSFKLSLHVNSYLEISSMLKTLYQNYEITGNQLHNFTFTFHNILKVYQESSEGIAFLGMEDVIVIYIQIIQRFIKKENYEESTILEMMLQIGTILGEPVSITKAVLSKNQNLLSTLIQLLPLQQTFKEVPIPRPVKWTHQDVKLTKFVMTALCNIASQDTLTFTLTNNGALKLVIELSAHPNSVIQEEVAIFLWNMVYLRKEDIGEILCEHDYLYAIRNILSSSCGTQQALHRILCSLRIIVELATTDKKQPFYWSFPRYKIKQILIRDGTFNRIELLCASSNHKISLEAQHCLQAFAK